MMITKEQYELLKKEYGNVSSWAFWAEPIEGKPKSNVGDISIFDTCNIYEELNSEYVFVALNAAFRKPDEIRIWDAFHSRDNRRQQDYKLRFALKDTPFYGSYITDALKGLVQTNSAEVMQHIKKNPEIEKANILKLKKELSVLQPRHLIAIGDNSYKILFRNFQTLSECLPELNLTKIKHYSYRISKENYRSEVLSVLQDL